MYIHPPAENKNQPQRYKGEGDEMRKSKPDILIVLALLIGLGVIATEAVRAFTDKTEQVMTTASR